MRGTRIAGAGLLGLLLCCRLPAGAAPAAEETETPASSDDNFSEDADAGFSKSMRLAIDLYKRGLDLDAMDRFMEILVKGDPSERPVANEYLNLITKRMAVGTRIDQRTPSGPTTVEKVPPGAGPRPGTLQPTTDRFVGEAPPAKFPEKAPGEPAEGDDSLSRSQGTLSRSDRALMKKEIEDKIRNRSQVLLGQLRRYEDISVRMANTRLPRAIGLPPELLFDSATNFKKDADKILGLLGDLAFSLGATQIVILPEGAILNESKVLHMRRTMAISSSLMRAGISPPRIRVNLLSTQVDVPRDMNNFKGILLFFVYNQPLTLSSEDELGSQAGPPISLGASPGTIDPEKGEGSIIEFSVVETPAGLMSWRFQLMGPGEKAADDMVPLQEVKGSAPVFHQIYWNGRSKYFGKTLTPGRYECILTATDMKNRSNKKRIWVTVEGVPPAPPPAAAAAKPAAAPAAAAPPPAELEPSAEEAPPVRARAIDPARARSGSRTRSARAAARLARLGRTAKGAKSRSTRKVPVATEESKAPTAEVGPHAAPAATAAAEPAPKARSGAVNYQVIFTRNTPNITRDGENILARVADTMHYYPLDNINLVGYAYAGETEPEKLASQRADLVAKLLIERHGMKSERIRVSKKVVDNESYKVEIYIVAGGQ